MARPQPQHRTRPDDRVASAGGSSVVTMMLFAVFTGVAAWQAFPYLLAPLLTPANLATALVVLNFIAFAAFGVDKAAAEAGRWRIAEATLLGWALIGGTPGAYAGRALFRHKTRKQPFSATLHRVAIGQAIALAVLAGWMLGG